MNEKLPKIRKLPSNDDESEEYESVEEEEDSDENEENYDVLRDNLKKLRMDPVFVDSLDDNSVKFFFYKKKRKTIENSRSTNNQESKKQQEEQDSDEEIQDDVYSIPISTYYIKSEVPKPKKVEENHPKWGMFHRCVPLHILENLPKEIQDKIIQDLNDNVSFEDICDTLVIPNMGDMMKLYTNE